MDNNPTCTEMDGENGETYHDIGFDYTIEYNYGEKCFVLFCNCPQKEYKRYPVLSHVSERVIDGKWRLILGVRGYCSKESHSACGM